MWKIVVMKPIMLSVIFFKKVTLSVFFFFCNYVLYFCSNEHLRVWIGVEMNGLFAAKKLGGRPCLWVASKHFESLLYNVESLSSAMILPIR